MDFLSKKAILTDIKSTRKEDVIKEMVDLLIEAGDVESDPGRQGGFFGD